MSAYRAGVAALAMVLVGLGVAIVVVTAVRGGAGVGSLIGVLFVLAGLGRLYLLRRR